MTVASNASREGDSRRSSANYRVSEKIRRILWHATSPLFFLSPRLLYGWRNTLLRAFGATIGDRVQIYPSVKVFAPWELEVGDGTTIGNQVRIYNIGRISIGNLVTISQYSHLCAGSHDYHRSDMKLLRLPIVIANNVWVCADSFVGPGITIGENAIIGARSAVFNTVDANTIVGGNPAKFIKLRLTNETNQHLNRAAA